MNRLIAHVLIPTSAGLLLIRRNAEERGKVSMFPGYWDAPGGLAETTETPRDAAVRECAEEVGLSVTLARIIAEDSQYNAKKRTLYTRLVYLAQPIPRLDPVTLHLDLQEHDQAALFTSFSEWPADRKMVPYLQPILATGEAYSSGTFHQS